MDTIYISDKTTNFSIARWLFLKKKLSHSEMLELSEKPRDEIIKKVYDFGFFIKMPEKKEVLFEPSEADLFDDDLDLASSLR